MIVFTIFFIVDINDLYCVKWGVKLYSLTHSYIRLELSQSKCSSVNVTHDLVHCHLFSQQKKTWFSICCCIILPDVKI